MDDKCECTDPGCPACKGKCRKVAVARMRRVDMQDETGVLFCQGCGEDAAEAGVFGEWFDLEAQAPADSACRGGTMKREDLIVEAARAALTIGEGCSPAHVLADEVLRLRAKLARVRDFLSATATGVRWRDAEKRPAVLTDEMLGADHHMDVAARLLSDVSAEGGR